MKSCIPNRYRSSTRKHRNSQKNYPLLAPPHPHTQRRVVIDAISLGRNTFSRRKCVVVHGLVDPAHTAYKTRTRPVDAKHTRVIDVPICQEYTCQPERLLPPPPHLPPKRWPLLDHTHSQKTRAHVSFSIHHRRARIAPSKMPIPATAAPPAATFLIF